MGNWYDVVFCVQVHNRPFLRAGDKRTTGGGGGGGQGGRAAAARPNADGAAPKGKRSRGGSRKPAVKFEPGEFIFIRVLEIKLTSCFGNRSRASDGDREGIQAQADPAREVHPKRR